MERASRVIRNLNVPGGEMTAERLACAAWGPSVGKKVAAHTRASRMVRTRLIVEVEDHVWQRQLFSLTPQILGVLARNVGPGVVEDLEFRVVPRRRDPQRAEAAVRKSAADEAAGIEDPILRSIYKASRKKALA